MKPAEAEAHIKRYGHEALYARHECRECATEWTCRQPVCKLAQKDILCRACEVESLLSDVLNIADALLPILDVKLQESVWSQSLKLALKPRVQCLRDDALRITNMERI